MTLPDRLLLDTFCFIYLLEHPASVRGGYLATKVIRPAMEGRGRLFAATLTITELLSQPFAGGQQARARGLLAAVEALPGLTLLPLTTTIAACAAALRGATGLTVPDAIVLATAADAGATLLTNDRRLAAASSDVLVLDDLVSAGDAGLS